MNYFKPEKYQTYWPNTARYSPISLQLTDSSPANSVSVKGTVSELHSFYAWKDLTVEDEDVMIDIGGHCGVVSIYYAMIFPQLKIYTYEPVPDNFYSLTRNLEMNKITNVEAFNLAVTSDGRTVELSHPRLDASKASITEKSGGYLDATDGAEYMDFHLVKSVTLNEIFKKNNIKKCRIMKVDCECSEYEIFSSYAKSGFKYEIENVFGEFHENGNLRRKGHSIESIMNMLHENNVNTRVASVAVADIIDSEGQIISLDNGKIGQLRIG